MTPPPVPVTECCNKASPTSSTGKCDYCHEAKLECKPVPERFDRLAYGIEQLYPKIHAKIIFFVENSRDYTADELYQKEEEVKEVLMASALQLKAWVAGTPLTPLGMDYLITLEPYGVRALLEHELYLL